MSSIGRALCRKDGVSHRFDDDRGQMTVELCMFLPVVIIIGTIILNAMSFFGYCGEFDRVARNEVRMHAASPAYGQTVDDVTGSISACLGSRFSEDEVLCEVHSEADAGGIRTYVATISFSPTLFGMGLRDEILGVPLPKLEHSAQLAVSPYRPGMLF